LSGLTTKLKHESSPKIEDSMERWRASTFGPHMENPLETCWEQMKNEKNPPHQTHTPLPPKLKRNKNQDTFECMLSLPIIGCMKFLIPKVFITIFNLD
jgi:hypothetical protein